MENVVGKKGQYRKPELGFLGQVGDVTLSQGDGDFTDFQFPQFTPNSELTFS